MPPTAPLPLLASLAEYPSFGDSVIFQINGLIVVFTALGSLWLMLEVTGAFFRHRAVRTADATRPAAPAPAMLDGARLDGDGVPDAGTIAAIAAAVHVVLGARPHRISVIAPSAAAPDWAREGRREIFSSHRVR